MNRGRSDSVEKRDRMRNETQKGYGKGTDLTVEGGKRTGRFGDK